MAQEKVAAAQMELHAKECPNNFVPIVSSRFAVFGVLYDLYMISK